MSYVRFLHSVYSIVLLAFLWNFWPTLVQPQTQLSGVEPIACPFDIPPGETITCGYLTVPENYTHPDSPTIRIFVTLIKSHSPTPAPDPIIYLRGGLGQPTSWFIAHELSQIQDWLAKRDVIVFDQRGLGQSQPALDCPAVHEVVVQEWLGVSLTLAEQLAPRLACRDRWLQQEIDVAAYNSFATAADVAAVWQALGYDRVNLIGASYWTIVAQLVMRRYGHTGQLRTIVLDSPVPLTVPAMADTPAQLSATMDRLFKACAADWLCQSAYPDLEIIYRQVMDRLQNTPTTVSATNPLNGTPFTFPFTIDDFGFAVQYGSYRQLPALIYDIHDNDYTSIITGRENSIRESTRYNAGQHFGLRTTQNCNEPWNTISPEQRAAMAVYPESAFMANSLDIALCAQWPAFDPGQQSLATGDTPTLVFTGEYDTRLPSAYGELIIDSLSRGYHFHVPGASHVVLKSNAPCSKLMVLNFFDNPTRSPDNRCLAATGSPRFDTEFVIRAAAVSRPVQVALWVITITLIVLAIRGISTTRQYRQLGLQAGLAWHYALGFIGWHSIIVSAGLAGLAIYAGQTGLLPVYPVNALALILPVVTAIQAAFLFSPEDEPALEVILAAPRPPAWTLLERLLVLFSVQGVVGLVASLYLVYITGESLLVTISRWLPPVFALSGSAVLITLATRRAMFGTLTVCLLWLVLALFGNGMVEHWPITWPLHLYLQPGQAQYGLNRLFLTWLGLAMIGWAAGVLLNNPERLLLGRQHTKRPAKTVPMTGATQATTLETTSPTLSAYHLVVTQLLAMVQYEFRLQWRRAALPALLIGLLITPVMGAMVAYSDFQGYKTALANGTLAFEVAQAEITTTMLPVMWLGVFLIATIMVPLVVAETIPKDKQIGVQELLNALPLSPGTYLAGKLLSLWLTLLVGVSLVALISGLVWWLIIGPFWVGLFLDLWLVGATLLILINAGLSMLLAAGQSTTRRAVLVSSTYVLCCLMGLAFIGPAITQGGWWHWLNPARPLVILYYLLGFPGAIEGYDDWTRAGVEAVQQATNHRAVLGSLGVGLVQVGLVWLIIWYWLKGQTK